MPPTKFGRLAIHDPRFVLDLRNGRIPRENMVRRIEGFMRAYRPPVEDDGRGDAASLQPTGGYRHD